MYDKMYKIVLNNKGALRSCGRFLIFEYFVVVIK